MAFKDTMARLNARINRYMQGRYGADQLGLALLLVSLVMYLLDLRLAPVGSVAGWVCVVVALWRMLSKDVAARSAENVRFLALVDKPRRSLRRSRSKWENRKTKAYVRCPHCHGEFSLPKGKGKLRATCPHCGEKSEHTV